MSAVAEKLDYTPEELLALPDDGKRYELVGGRLVERNMILLSSWIGAEIVFLLRTFLVGKQVGFVFNSDNGYQCFPHDPRLVRRPDVSFVRRERLPDGLTEGWSRAAPDLAVEVVSPNDRAVELEEKLEDYRRADVPLVWVVYPEARLVIVHGRNSYERLGEDDELTGGEVLPGFRCRVADLLPPRVEAGGSKGTP